MEFFAPRISADTEAFWKGCREHKLMVGKCNCCGRLIWPASFICPDCLSSNNEMVELAPEGTLYSYVIMYKHFHPSLESYTPYVVAAIDLKDGIRIEANILEWDPQSLKCGAQVDIDFEDSETYSRPIARLKQGGRN